MCQVRKTLFKLLHLIDPSLSESLIKAEFHKVHEAPLGGGGGG